MKNMQVQSLGQEDPMKKEMATHYNIHAWKILCTAKPGRLQSMRSQKSQTWLSDDWQVSHVVKFKYNDTWNVPHSLSLVHRKKHNLYSNNHKCTYIVILKNKKELDGQFFLRKEWLTLSQQ